jgi:hypothetical protein
MTLSPINKAMTSKTRRIREPLSTPNVLALMWLFTSVSTDVNSQRTPLNEALAATWGHARVRSLICVDSIMSLEIRFSVETFVASLPVTLEGSCVRLVLYQLHDVHSDILHNS